MAKLTPMMAQYQEIKANYQDCILMFRLGDFYEMFFEDAVEAAGILHITLTSRNKGAVAKAQMCGIPYHALDNYLAKLTRAGKKVALCDQVTKPTGKGIVQREVVRVVTPGTTFDENILEYKSNNYVSAIVKGKQGYAFAFSDITTGEFKISEFDNIKNLATELLKVSPSECICDEKLISEDSALAAVFQKNQNINVFPYKYNQEAENSLKKYFKIHSLSIFGLENKPLAIQVAAMLYEYLRETQKTELKHIQKISYYKNSEFMPLDEACIRNLELFFTNRDNKREGSLIWVLDQTVTAMGGRLLKKCLLNPLLKKIDIEARLEKVRIFVEDSSLVRNLREKFAKIHDIERLLSRLTIGNGNARDLLSLNYSLAVIPDIKSLIKDISVFQSIHDFLDPLDELQSLINQAISDNPPVSLRDGGIIRDGYNTELDELRNISSEGKNFIKKLQEKEIKRTGINSLKVKFNKVFGYYIEISKTNLSSVPDDYIRKQTLVNAERFIIPELKEYEEKVLNAEDRIKELEYDLFYEIKMELVKEILKLQKNAQALAQLDVFSNFAFIAVKNNYCKPNIIENGSINIKNSRHPVLEQLNFAGDFVPNDCDFNKNRRFMLITGPNMGGKSTYLRQIALAVLMAQIGSYIPAEKADISVVDRIFTRVGASDNLVKGESTFMVEMQETSYILNNASEKSLIILDEIGRGTSTYDGVSIAWAITEYIHNELKSKTIFASHYHELIHLVAKLENSINMSVAVSEKAKEDIVFLYKVIEGGINKSYGIEVAKLAGLPDKIIDRSRSVLKNLESKELKKSAINKNQLDLFEEKARTHQTINEFDKQISNKLKGIDINNLTPVEALKTLDELKKKLSN